MSLLAEVARIARVLADQSGETAALLSDFVSWLRIRTGASGITLRLHADAQPIVVGEVGADAISASFDNGIGTGSLGIAGAPDVDVEALASVLGLALAARAWRDVADIDALTGVNNRRSFDETLVAEWRRCLRDGTQLAVLIIDIDYFKVYNDRFGHQAGDECLRRVARAAADCTRRAGDMFARYGGEEFGVVLPATDLAGAIAHAQDIRTAIERLRIPHPINAGGLVTVSLGAAAVVPSMDGATAALVADADAALYRAKAAGRNRVAGGEFVSAAAPAHDRTLPVPLSTLHGRRAERISVAAALTSARIVTLRGRGGIGKTRLALAVATDVAPLYDDVIFVDVQGARDEEELDSVISSAFDLDRSASSDRGALIAQRFAKRSALVVIDNAEQLLGPCASLLRALHVVAGLDMVVTSRVEIEVDGECVVDVGALDSAASVDLFLERLRGAGIVRPLNDRAIAEIVDSIAGNPLSIELAASLCAVLGEEDMHARVLARPLANALADAPRATFDSLIGASVAALGAAEREAFEALCLFRSSFSVAAAAAIIPATERDERRALDTLQLLGARSLVVAESRGGVTRFRLHPLVARAARARLASNPQRLELIERLIAYAVAHVRAGDDLSGGVNTVWLAHVETAVEEIRAALELALADSRTIAAGGELLRIVTGYFRGRGLSDENRAHANAFLQHRGEIAPRMRAMLHNILANVGYAAGDFDAMESAARDALRALGDDDDASEASPALNILGIGAKLRGDIDGAVDAFERGVALNRRIGNARGLAVAIGALGCVALDLHLDFDRAVAYFAESRDAFLALGDDLNVLVQQSNLAEAEASRGNVEEARRLVDAVMAHSPDYANGPLALSFGQYALVFERSGALDRAGAVLAQAATMNLGHQGQIDLADGAARIMSALGHDDRAARLMGISERWSTDWSLPYLASNAFWRAKLHATLCAKLGEPAVALERSRGFEAEFVSARRLVDEAIAYCARIGSVTPV